MRIKKWLKYLVYIFFICILIFLKEYVVERIELDFKRNLKMNYVHYIFIPFILNLFIGLILGIEHFMEEMKKDGSWIINIPKLILLGLPSLFFSLTYLFGLLRFEFTYKILGMITLFGGNFIPVFQIILGYTLITCLYKGEKNTKEYN